MIKIIYTIYLINLFFIINIQAKKILVFDEKQGIMWVDENDKRVGKKKSFNVPKIKAQKKEVIVEEKKVKVRDYVKTKPNTAKEYFDTGSQFYYGGDFEEAIKYFKTAWSKKKNPLYYFWIGACLRRLEEFGKMRIIFQNIVRNFPKSKIADDALFYLAVQDQKENDYEGASEKYRDIIELYPTGRSITGNFIFRNEAKKQLRTIKIDLLSRLNILKYSEKNLVELIKEFQRDHNLRPTGLPNKKTMDILIKKSDTEEKRLARRLERSSSVFDKRIVYYSIVNIFLLMGFLWGVSNLNSIKDCIRRFELVSRDINGTK